MGSQGDSYRVLQGGVEEVRLRVRGGLAPGYRPGFLGGSFAGS